MSDLAAPNDYRSRLLTGLATALEERSLSELHTGDIAREASVSKRTFYEHFANKEECFLALYKENSARILQALREAIQLPELTLLQRIESGTQAYLTAMQGQAALMNRLYVDVLGLGPAGTKAKRLVVQQFADLLMAAYEAERAKVAGMPPLRHELIVGIIAGLNELILFKIEDGEAAHLLELSETTRLMILGSIQGVMLQQGTGE